MSLEENKQVDYKLFKCEVCGKFFKGITNTHLAKHGMTREEYVQRYPDAKTQWNEGLTKETDKRVEQNAVSTKNSYVGTNLKIIRKLAALEQMSDPKQREIRSKKMRGVRKRKQRKNLTLEQEHRILKDLLIKKRGKKCEICGKQESSISLHHKDGRTWINTEENGILLCRSCHKTLHFKEKLSNRLENLLAEVFDRLDVDLKDENWLKTPTRFAKVLLQFFSGYTEEDLQEIFESSFSSKLNDMVIIKNIPVYGFCPHHVLPVSMRVNIGYIPNGRVLGLSKFKRIAKMLAQVPILQEEYTEKIADVIMEHLKPDGVMVTVTGQHMCMCMRGVEQHDAKVTTSAQRGNFKQHETRMEFLSLIKEKSD
jgi:GTP cyclohydrolase I